MMQLTDVLSTRVISDITDIPSLYLICRLINRRMRDALSTRNRDSHCRGSVIVHSKRLKGDSAEEVMLLDVVTRGVVPKIYVFRGEDSSQ